MNNLSAIETTKDIIDRLSQPALLLTKNNIMFCNSVFFQLTGYSEKSMISLKDLFFEAENIPLDIFQYSNQKNTFPIILKTNNDLYKKMLANVSIINPLQDLILVTLINLYDQEGCSNLELNFNDLYNQTPFGIICFDKDLKIKNINKPALRMFDLQVRKNDIKEIQLQDIIPEQNLEFFKEKLKNCFQLNEQKIVIININKNNSEPMICKWHLTYCTENQVLVYIYDITKEKVTEHSINKEKSKLESSNLKLKQALKETRKLTNEVSYANNAKSEFIANISHEIRTPLNAIMGFSEILAKAITDPKHINYLNSIIQSGRSLLDIINGILDYSKLEAGKMKIKASEMNIHNFLHSISNIFRDLAEQKGLKYDLKIDDNLPSYLELDKHLFSQIIRNLIDNAVKFTKEGFVSLEVKCESIEDDFIDLIIIVQDSGIGIPKNQQQKIFYAFSQKDGQTHADYGGTGLGLSIVKKTVALFSGKLKMKSKPGKGTTFEIILPHINKTNKNDEQIKVIINNLDVSRIDFIQKTLLIIDKTKFTRLLIKNLLSNYSINYVETSSISEANQKFEEQQIDILLINESILKQKSNDKNFLLLQKFCETKNLPVIVLGNNFIPTISKLWKQIDYIFIDKPIRKEELIKAIARLIEYKTIKKKEESVNKQEILPKSFPKERLARMLNYLEVEILPKCDYYQENMIINKIEELCEEISTIGEQNQILSIIKWTKKLRMALDNFDILKIKTLLQQFNEITQEIGSLLKDKQIN